MLVFKYLGQPIVVLSYHGYFSSIRQPLSSETDIYKDSRGFWKLFFKTWGIGPFGLCGIPHYKQRLFWFLQTSVTKPISFKLEIEESGVR